MQLQVVAVYGLVAFCVLLLVQVLPIAAGLFFRKFARAHRLTGLCYLTLLLLGVVDLAWPGDGLFPNYRFLHAILLPAVGIVLSLTAAFDFRKAHARVKNVASGTLDDDQTVTFSEMVEHSFYQGLNMLQAAYLCYLDSGNFTGGISTSLVCFLLVCSPWIVRYKFPVNSFSANYTVEGRDRWALTSVLYRLKKYQYVLYKHALFFGLNITAATLGARGITTKRYFELYWLCLNCSYVMEFFLQTLVKRGYATQRWLMVMQHLLMSISTVTALQVLWYHVELRLAAVSIFLNFSNRGHEGINMVVLAGVGFLLAKYLE